MINQRKKDYLQQLIEHFFAKLSELANENRNSEDLASEQKQIVQESFSLFQTEYGVNQEDLAEKVIDKIQDLNLIEQYAKLLKIKYETSDIKEIHQLHVALDLVEYIEATDRTYSWERTILKEDILRLLDT